MSEDNSCLRSVSDYVALSGAAVDMKPYSTGWEAFGLTLAGIWGIELGDYSINPSNLDQPAYLSDGGHSDNLGAYSLIKRGVGKIIVSDAEADPDGSLGGLKRLYKQLKNEGKLLSFYTIKNGTRTPIREFNECLASGDDNVPCLSIAYDRDSIDRDVADWELSPIINGEVKMKDGQKITEVLYVKLRALDKYQSVSNDQEQYPKATLYIINNDRDKKAFPHVSTFDVNFSPTQYYAYFSLGRFYGEQLKKHFVSK